MGNVAVRRRRSLDGTPFTTGPECSIVEDSATPGSAGGYSAGTPAHRRTMLTPRRFLAGVYATRFAPLDAPAPGPLASPLGRANGSPPSELADCLAAAPQSGDGAPEADPRLRLRIDDFAQSVAVLLTQPDPAWGGRRFERGVAVELAADYVEELAGWGAGGAEDVRRLLQLLLTMDPEGGGAAVHDSLGWG